MNTHLSCHSPALADIGIASSNSTGNSSSRFQALSGIAGLFQRTVAHTVRLTGNTANRGFDTLACWRWTADFGFDQAAGWNSREDNLDSHKRCTPC